MVSPSFRAVRLAGISFAALTLIFPSESKAQDRQNNELKPEALGVRISTPIEIDGSLQEDAWVGAQPLSGFVQNEPMDGDPVTERTEVRILYDDNAVYFGMWLYDSDPSAIVFGETRRDADLTDTDAVLIVLDTYLDRQNGFVFGTTPAGIEYDGQVTKEGEGGFGGNMRQQRGSGGGFNLNWDGSWEVATSRSELGWFAEFRIPFSTLRYGGGGEQVWGLNISRNIRRKNEQAFWSPVPRQFDLYRVSQAGTLSGIDAPAKRVIDATPYVLAGNGWEYSLTGDPTISNRKTEIGADLKFGVTPSLTLDLTYNTDFAQVEVDDEQINLTRFRLFFPEKRPFFLENAGTFSVGTPQSVELFFSRRIGFAGGQSVPILGGGRLSGRVGSFSVGILNIQTQKLEDLDSLGQTFTVSGPNNYSVARVLREFPNRTHIGTIAAARVNADSSDDYNVTLGLDGRLGIGDAVSLDGYVATSMTPGINGGTHAVNLSSSYATRNWSGGAAFRQVGDGFNPEVGFLERKAYRFYTFRVLRHMRVPQIPWFREARPHINYREFRDLNGFTETRVVHIDSHFEFANGAFFQLPALNLTREGLQDPFEIHEGVVVPAGTYDNVEFQFRFNTNESAPLSVSGRIVLGGLYGGSQKVFDVTANGRIGDTFVASFRANRADVKLPEGSFVTSLLSLRTAYSFTPRIYLQSLIQYNGQTDDFSMNVRFGWLSTAGTGLFLVYNDVEQVDALPSRFSRWQPVNRALLMKFTQQFNLTR